MCSGAETRGGEAAQRSLLCHESVPPVCTVLREPGSARLNSTCRCRTLSAPLACLQTVPSEPTTHQCWLRQLSDFIYYIMIILISFPSPQSLGVPGSLKNAFDHLTSRDPKKFWTSGQWMTERRGGSDVGTCSEVGSGCRSSCTCSRELRK